MARRWAAESLGQRLALSEHTPARRWDPGGPASDEV